MAAPTFSSTTAGATADLAALRQTMVDCQIRTYDVTDQTLLAKLLDIPREVFLPPELLALAYSDIGLKIKISSPEEAQRGLLPPLILARLIQAAEVNPSDKVLDVAAGTGYSTAIFAALGAEVVALESDPALAEAIPGRLAKIGSKPVQTVVGSLAAGAPAQAPFDLIFVNGAVETHLDALFGQLKEGGRLMAIKVAPVGQTSVRRSHAVRIEKINGAMSSRFLFDASAPVLNSFHAGIQFIF